VHAEHLAESAQALKQSAAGAKQACCSWQIKALDSGQHMCHDNSIGIPSAWSTNVLKANVLTIMCS
jgi:hypothetical protein